MNDKLSALLKYDTWIFDCDGVILNSNKVKTQSYSKVVKSFGGQATSEFLEYHQNNGGVARGEKIEFFFKEILKKNPKRNEIDSLINKFSHECITTLVKVDIANSLSDLIELLKSNGIKNYVVSGGAEEELHEVFARREIDSYFDGIYGSPRNKYEIINQIKDEGRIASGAVLVGDSEYDYEVAKYFNFDFVFLSDWTGFRGWENFMKRKDCFIFNNINDLYCAILS